MYDVTTLQWNGYGLSSFMYNILNVWHDMNVDIFMQFYKDKFHFPNVAQRELNCDHIENKIYGYQHYFIFYQTLFVFKMAKKWVKTFFIVFFYMKHVDIVFYGSLELFFGLNFSIKID